MSDIVGIDLGTTNSLIGVMDSGFPILIADRDGSRLTPSVVYLPETGEPVVGAPADRMRALFPERTIYSIKRLIGRRPGESEKGEFPLGVKPQGGRTLLEVGDRLLRLEEVSSLVLNKLKADGEISLGNPVDR